MREEGHIVPRCAFVEESSGRRCELAAEPVDHVHDFGKRHDYGEWA